jgi:hypothetical protein
VVVHRCTHRYPHRSYLSAAGRPTITPARRRVLCLLPR